MRRKNHGQAWLQIALAASLLLTAASAEAQSAPGPGDSDLYCAGFFTTDFLENALTVQSSEDSGFKYEFSDRDYLYLNRGQDTIVNTGGHYMLLRRRVDDNRKESFPGQLLMLKGMGTLYAEIGRLEIRLVRGEHAVGEVLRSCEPIEPGDIAIPLNARTTPDYRAQRQTVRFAEPTGKAVGVIAAGKEFDRMVGEGKIVYLNIGSAQGLQPGSYLYIRRPFSSSADAFSKAGREYLGADGKLPRRMLESDLAAMPSEVIGEVMVITAKDNTATGIVTYSRLEAQVGDNVELQ